MRGADAVLDVLHALGPVGLVGASEAFFPVRVIDRVVDKHARLDNRKSDLLSREITGLIKINAIKPSEAH